MKFSILAVVALGSKITAMAATPSQSVEQFCADRSTPGYAKETSMSFHAPKKS